MYSQAHFLNRDVELPLGMTHMKSNGLDTDLPQDLETFRQKCTTLVKEGYLELGIDYEKILDRTGLCNKKSSAVILSNVLRCDRQGKSSSMFCEENMWEVLFIEVGKDSTRSSSSSTVVFKSCRIF